MADEHLERWALAALNVASAAAVAALPGDASTVERRGFWMGFEFAVRLAALGMLSSGRQLNRVELMALARELCRRRQANGT